MNVLLCNGDQLETKGTMSAMTPGTTPGATVDATTASNTAVSTIYGTTTSSGPDVVASTTLCTVTDIAAQI